MSAIYNEQKDSKKTVRCQVRLVTELFNICCQILWRQEICLSQTVVLSNRICWKSLLTRNVLPIKLPVKKIKDAVHKKTVALTAHVCKRSLSWTRIKCVEWKWAIHKSIEVCCNIGDCQTSHKNTEQKLCQRWKTLVREPEAERCTSMNATVYIKLVLTPVYTKGLLTLKGPFTSSKSENFLWCLNFFFDLFRLFFYPFYVRCERALTSAFESPSKFNIVSTFVSPLMLC